jgi:alpha-beta hydrolase superfamily lysophospholipase
VAGAVLVRPSLWLTAVRTLARLAAPGWWRRRPHLPLPDADYLRFRMETQYGGDGSTPPAPADVVAYLRWCRRTRLG